MYYVCMDDTYRKVETVSYVPKINVKKEEHRVIFNILEILVILSAITVVGLLFLLAVNPNKEASEARNLKRKADVSYILSTVSSYSESNNTIDEEIPISNACVNFGNEICRTGPYNCKDLVNMDFLSKQNTDELVIMPTDPLYISINGTGYFISNNGKGLITVCAPYSERNEEISFSKFLY
jgi:competence protein ComGC